MGENRYSTVSNSYYSENVTGGGGLSGANCGIVSNSFWDIETSGQATPGGGTGKTTTEMKDLSTLSAWGIVTVANPSMRNPSYIWNIVNNATYPFLSWQLVS
jgi:hypothetical protein